MYVCANFTFFPLVFPLGVSTGKKFSASAVQKNIGLHEAYDIIKIFCSVGEKKGSKKFDTFHQWHGMTS